MSRWDNLLKFQNSLAQFALQRGLERRLRLLTHDRNSPKIPSLMPQELFCSPLCVQKSAADIPRPAFGRAEQNKEPRKRENGAQERTRTSTPRGAST